MRLRTCLITAAIFSAGLLARADTIKAFNVLGSGSLTGDLIVDTTRGSVTDAFLVLDQNGTSTPLDSFSQGGIGRLGYQLTFNAIGNQYQLLLTATSTDSLAGYSGGPFMFTSITGAGETSGDLVAFTPPPSTVPEPSTLLLLGSGALTLAGAVRRRILG